MDRNQYPGRSLLGLPRGNLGPQELGLLSMALPPVAGDAVGLLADGMGYAQDPKSLTPMAGLLSLAGMIPGVPNKSAMGAVNSPLNRQALLTWVQEAGSLKKALKQLRKTAKETGDPEIQALLEYGDDMDGILRFHRAEDSGESLRKWLKSQKNPELSLAAEIDAIESGVKQVPRHPGGW